MELVEPVHGSSPKNQCIYGTVSLRSYIRNFQSLDSSERSCPLGSHQAGGIDVEDEIGAGYVCFFSVGEQCPQRLLQRGSVFAFQDEVETIGAFDFRDGCGGGA
jgi:hypothetical protein